MPYIDGTVVFFEEKKVNDKLKKIVTVAEKNSLGKPINYDIEVDKEYKEFEDVQILVQVRPFNNQIYYRAI